MVLKRDTATTPTGETVAELPQNLEQLLDGMALPAAKVDILDYAAEQGADEDALEILRALPKDEYATLNEINAALGKLEKQPGSDNLWT